MALTSKDWSDLADVFRAGAWGAVEGGDNAYGEGELGEALVNMANEATNKGYEAADREAAAAEAFRREQPL